MEVQVFVALISAAAAVFVSALTYYLTKKKDRHSDWRKYKFDRYLEFVSALGGMAPGSRTLESQRRYCEACNRLYLIASAPVIVAFHEYQGEIIGTATSVERQNKLLTNLLKEIRSDLDMPNADCDGELNARVWDVIPK